MRRAEEQTEKIPRKAGPLTDDHDGAREEQPIPKPGQDEGQQDENQFLGENSTGLARLDAEKTMACLEIKHETVHHVLETRLQESVVVAVARRIHAY